MVGQAPGNRRGQRTSRTGGSNAPAAALPRWNGAPCSITASVDQNALNPMASSPCASAARRSAGCWRHNWPSDPISARYGRRVVGAKWQPARGHDADHGDADGREREHRAPAGRFWRRIRPRPATAGCRAAAPSSPCRRCGRDARRARASRRPARRPAPSSPRGRSRSSPRAAARATARWRRAAARRPASRPGHDHAAAVETVAERREQQDAERIAELRERGDEADCPCRRAEMA